MIVRKFLKQFMSNDCLQIHQNKHRPSYNIELPLESVCPC